MASGSTLERNPGASAVMDTTGLVFVLGNTGLSGSSTAWGWQSQVFSDITSRSCDYQISIQLAMNKSAPGADKAVYAYVVPWYYDGASWFAPSLGTSAFLCNSATGGTVYISPVGHNLGNPKVYGVNAANEVVGGEFNISPFVGDPLPDGFQLVLLNNSTCCVLGSGQALTNMQYKSIKWNSITT